MISRRLVLAAAMATLFGTTVSSATAAERNVTVMNVGEMCSGCVKKITARLTQLPEVAGVKCDIAKKTVAVTPKSGTLSARALWEAMDEIGKSPKRLVDATGTYTAKPAN
ncbi:MAG: heavy-metal-associated domain-containing protein [Planctomycetes bacterium]|nr:heavy-metal-associated domain-containing protein [Planctomycetota bacterium]